MTPLFVRHPRRYREHLFDDLPLEKQEEAQQRLWRYCHEHRGDPRRGLYPILIGQARRWTMTSQEERSRWGRIMAGKRGAKALYQKLQSQGLTGKNHPYAHKAARKSVARRKNRKEETERQRPGLPVKTRCKWLPIS
jgi:hypothetical protein